jgi:hypothetical protein
MFVRPTVLLVVAVLVIAIGAYLDHANAQPIPSCDHKCRMKRFHKDCDTTDYQWRCLKFLDPTCLLCTLNNQLCLDEGDYDSSKPTCLTDDDPINQNRVDYKQTCTELCDCNVTTWSQATVNLSGNPYHIEYVYHADCVP